MDSTLVSQAQAVGVINLTVTQAAGGLQLKLP
jgi:hypothetical protein